MLVDAPCSGLGTLRRHPELRYRRTEDDIGRLATLQRAILETLPGGRHARRLLVYAVCSTEPQEGTDQVEMFLRSHPDFTAEPPKGLPPCRLSQGYLQTLPGPEGTRRFLRRAAAEAFVGVVGSRAMRVSPTCWLACVVGSNPRPGCFRRRDLQARRPVRQEGNHPKVAKELEAAMASAVKASPEDYEVLWRASRYHVWLAEKRWARIPRRRRRRSRVGIWGDAARKVKPEGVEGNYFAAASVGLWS